MALRIEVAWSATANQQFHALTKRQQASARNVVQAIIASPRAAHYYHTAKQRDGTVRAVWVIYGLEVRMLFTLAEDGQRLLVRIIDVAPSDLPSITDYEERTGI